MHDLPLRPEETAVREGKTLGRRPKPRLEPSFGEGSKDSKNFTAKGTRRGGSWRHVLRFRVPFAVKLWNSWSFFREEVPSGGWGGASKSSPSLRSVRELGWLRYEGAFKQRRSRLLAPRQGGGVRLRGAVWLWRSPLHPVCRFAQDDTVGNRSVIRNFFGAKYSTVKLTDTAFCVFLPRSGYSLCHPERSGTTHQKSSAPTNHCRAVEPRPKRGASRRDLHC